MQYTHPNYNALMSQFSESARRMGLTPEQLVSREQGLKRQEDKNRLRAMDPNKSKGMSADQKMQALNATKFRRFREQGIGMVPGEWD